MRDILPWAFLIGAIVLIVRGIADAHARAVAARAALDLELRIIEKLDTPEALANYLATSDQRPVTAALSTRAQADRSVQAVQIAILSFSVGAGVLVVGAILPHETDDRLFYFGVLMIALAIGFAAVAVVTRKLLVEWTKPSSPPSI